MKKRYVSCPICGSRLRKTREADVSKEKPEPLAPYYCKTCKSSYFPWQIVLGVERIIDK